MTTAFDSTIAITAYNLLCVHGGRLDKRSLLNESVRMQHPELESDQFERAVAGLLQRKLVTTDGNSLLLVDPNTRPVVSRNLKDMTSGERTGGWSNWVVRDGSNMRSLESVLNEVSR